MQDTSQEDFPTFVHVSYAIGVALTQSGKIVVWQASNLNLLFGISGSLGFFPETTTDLIPADIRGIIPANFTVAGISSLSVFLFPVLMSSDGRFLHYDGSPQSRFINTSRLPVGGEVVWFGSSFAALHLLLYRSGELFIFGGSLDTNDPITGDRFQYFPEDSYDTRTWLPAEPARGIDIVSVHPCISTARESVNTFLALARNGTAFWIGSEPFPGASTTGSVTSRNFTQLDVGPLRPSGVSDFRFKQFRTKGDFYVVQDFSSRWWGFGFNGGGQLCYPQAQTGNWSTPAREIRLPNGKNITDIFPIISLLPDPSGNPSQGMLLIAEDQTVYACVRESTLG